MLIPPLHLLLLAAGQSRRMAPDDKLLLTIKGKPMIRRIAEMAMATGLPLSVVLSTDHPERAIALRGLGLHQITLPEDIDASGMAISLRHGLAAIPPDCAVMVILGDQPDLTTTDLMRVIEQWQLQPHRIHRGGTGTGTPGHPVILPAALRPALAEMDGDNGARDIIAAASEQPILVLLPAQNAVVDIDTPEDWENWRANNPA